MILNNLQDTLLIKCTPALTGNDMAGSQM